MRKAEQKFWDRIRANLGRLLRFERQENLVSVGDPDLTCTAPRNWVTRIELKSVATPPARPGTPLLGEARGLSIEQRNWHMEHRRAGGISYVLISCGSYKFWTIDGGLHDEVNSFTIDELNEHSMASDWNTLLVLLRGSK